MTLAMWPSPESRSSDNALGGLPFREWNLDLCYAIHKTTDQIITVSSWRSRTVGQVVTYSDAQAAAVIAMLRLISHVDPDGSTKPRDEILGILVIGERCIARHAQDFIW